MGTKREMKSTFGFHLRRPVQAKESPAYYILPKAQL